MIFAALFLLAQAPDAVAECTDPTTQGEMNACAKQEFDRVDAELNAVWKKVRGWAKNADAKLDRGDGQSGYAESLLAAQRAWLTYRDTHCQLVSFDARGGSMQPLLINNCLTELTENRTAELRELLVNQVSGEPKTLPET